MTIPNRSSNKRLSGSSRTSSLSNGNARNTRPSANTRSSASAAAISSSVSSSSSSSSTSSNSAKPRTSTNHINSSSSASTSSSNNNGVAALRHLGSSSSSSSLSSLSYNSVDYEISFEERQRIAHCIRQEYDENYQLRDLERFSEMTIREQARAAPTRDDDERISRRQNVGSLRNARDLIRYDIEEYHTWRKNAPFMYLFLNVNQTEWPSRTIEWLPDVHQPTNKDFRVHKLIVGTETDRQEPNYIYVYQARLSFYDMEHRAMPLKTDFGANYPFVSKIEPHFRIPHQGDVLRARHLPQASNIIASRSSNGKTYLFDIAAHSGSKLNPRTKKAAIPETNAPFSPLLELGGDSPAGIPLVWSPLEAGKLATAGPDGIIQIYDLAQRFFASAAASTAGASDRSTKIDEYQRLAAKRQSDLSAIRDVEFNPENSNIIASAHANRTIRLWDVRAGSTANTVVAHSAAVNCVAFNHNSDRVFVTASDDAAVKIWDSRSMTREVRVLEGHREPVRFIRWFRSAINSTESVFATGGDDCRVLLWDLCRTWVEPNCGDPGSTGGEALQVLQATDLSGTPIYDAKYVENRRLNLGRELFFIHGGHRNATIDFSWNANEEWLCASLDDHHVMMVWSVAEHNIPGRDESGERRRGASERQAANDVVEQMQQQIEQRERASRSPSRASRASRC